MNMASPAFFTNAPIDLDSARMCKEEAIAYAHSPGLSMTKRDNLREFTGLCDDVIAGRALFDDAFPHGAESTFLWLAYGKSV
jgi:hypothetical protein